jgi:hypothetical protein
MSAIWSVPGGKQNAAGRNVAYSRGVFAKHSHLRVHEIAVQRVQGLRIFGSHQLLRVVEGGCHILLSKFMTISRAFLTPACATLDCHSNLTITACARMHSLFKIALRKRAHFGMNFERVGARHNRVLHQ